MKLLYQISPEFEAFTPGAMWSDARVGIMHWAQFAKIAVVSDIDWIWNATRLFAPLIPGEVHVFDNRGLKQAKSWICQRDDAANTQASETRIETDAAKELDARATEALGATGSATVASADDYSCDLVTRSGLTLHVRPVRPQDEPLLAEFFAHVTAEDLRFRFLDSAREISHERLVAMTRVDHELTENFLALVDDGRTIAGTAMLACDATMKTAEVAISVRADYKHKGVAWELLRHVARYAEAKGVELLELMESRENHEAIELEREQGFVAEAYAGDFDPRYDPQAI